MDDKDKIKFASIMRAFEVNCSVEKITKEQLNLYFTAFKQFSISEVKTAFQKVMYDWIYNRMPPVGVFAKALKKNQPLIEDLAEIQAAEVLKQMQICGGYETPKFTDPITKELMKHRFNFSSLCRTLKETETKWFVKEFVQAYKAFDRNKESLLIESPPELKQIANNLFESIE